MVWYRKGQLGGVSGFQTLVLSIVAASVILAVGLIILSSLSTTTKEMYTTAVSNESVASGAGLKQGYLLISASACRNLSSTVLVLGSNCNVSSTGTVTVAPADATGNVLIDYSHYTPTAAYNASNSTITKLATVPTWIGIIIIVSLSFIVLGYFIGKRQ